MTTMPPDASYSVVDALDGLARVEAGIATLFMIGNAMGNQHDDESKAVFFVAEGLNDEADKLKAGLQSMLNPQPATTPEAA